MRLLVGFTFLFVLTACAPLKPIQQVNLKPDTGVLYVIREDAALSMNDKIVVYLNKVKAAEINEFDGYKALILTPGKYTIQFDVFNKKNELIKRYDYSEEVKPNKKYMCVIAFNFGWRGWKKFFDAEKKSIFARHKFRGEINLTGIIKPQ